MLNVAKFESVDHRFEFTRHDDLLELRTTTQSMTDGLHHRVIEALQFVLARPVPWKLLTFDGDVKSFRIRSEPKLSIIPTSYPPIDSVRFHDLTLCVWPLYIKYFDFIRDHPPHSWHPLSMFFYSVIEARAAGFDTFRLALGVAVEGILKTAFSDLCPTSDDFFAAADDAKRHLSDWKWKQPHDEAGLKRRLMGFFGQLRNPRADDKLRRLVAAEVITKEEHESWKELRNKAAHAYRPDRPPDQSEIDQGMRATTLMHKLIFQAIGYSGKYTDYGTHGFPMREFVAVAL